MLLNPEVLDRYADAAAVDVRECKLVLTIQQNILRSQIEWQEGMGGGEVSPDEALFSSLLDQMTDWAQLFRYCVGHRECLADVCRMYRLAAVAQYMRHSRAYDLAWETFCQHP